MLQDLAGPLLDLLAWSARYSTRGGFAGVAVMRWLAGIALFFHGTYHVDRPGEDFVHTAHLLTAALDIGCAHSLGYAVALFWGDGGQALGFEELDAGALVAEI